MPHSQQKNAAHCLEKNVHVALQANQSQVSACLWMTVMFGASFTNTESPSNTPCTSTVLIRTFLFQCGNKIKNVCNINFRLWCLTI